MEQFYKCEITLRCQMKIKPIQYKIKYCADNSPTANRVTPVYEPHLSKTQFIKYYLWCQRKINYINRNFILSFTIKKIM